MKTPECKCTGPWDCQCEDVQDEFYYGKTMAQSGKISKSKTFQKGDDYGEMIEWFMKQIDTHDYQPEGTNWSGGEPAPYDPVCELKSKYRIVVTKIDAQ